MSTKPRKAQYKIKKPKKAIIGGGATEGGKPQKPKPAYWVIVNDGGHPLFINPKEEVGWQEAVSYFDELKERLVEQGYKERPIGPLNYLDERGIEDDAKKDRNLRQV